MKHIQERLQREFVDVLSDSAQKGGTYQSAGSRAARLTLRLLPLKTFVSTTMEELFFAGLIGNVQIDNIIPYILQMETPGYNSHVIGQVLSVPHGVAPPSLSSCPLATLQCSLSVQTPSPVRPAGYTSPVFSDDRRGGVGGAGSMLPVDNGSVVELAASRH